MDNGMVRTMSKWRLPCRRCLDYLSLLILVPFVVWAAVPSSVFLQPQAVHYDGQMVTLVRRVPFGQVEAIWTKEMRVTGTNQQCYSGSDANTVEHIQGRVDPESGQNIGEETVVYIEGDWALPCLHSPPPIIVSHTWRVLLFGVFPLRPVRISETIESRLE